jgi:hypothetical protein
LASVRGERSGEERGELRGETAENNGDRASTPGERTAPDDTSSGGGVPVSGGERRNDELT